MDQKNSLLSNHQVNESENDRIAQVIIEKIEPTEIEEVIELKDTERGEGGFGHTGVNADESKT